MRLCRNALLSSRWRITSLQQAARWATHDASHQGSEESSGGTFQQVIDAPRDNVPQSVAAKFKTAFWHQPTKHCRLCDETAPVNLNLHNAQVKHLARVGILERAMSGAACVDPFELPKKTWHNLTQHPTLDFGRLGCLSSESAESRLQRITYLLRFLVDRGVIKHSLTLYSPGSKTANRQIGFQTCEMIGDNVVKYVFNSRIMAMFPRAQGGVSGLLFHIQQMLDSNDGLRSIYEHFKLDYIVGCYLPNSKMKSDVVESLFGELQVVLWASERTLDASCTRYDVYYTSEERYVVETVRHLLNEMAHHLLQWAIEETLGRGKEFIQECLQQLPHHAVAAAALKQKTAALQSKLSMLPQLRESRSDNTNSRPRQVDLSAMTLSRSPFFSLAAEPQQERNEDDAALKATHLPTGCAVVLVVASMPDYLTQARSLLALHGVADTAKPGARRLRSKSATSVTRLALQRELCARGAYVTIDFAERVDTLAATFVEEGSTTLSELKLSAEAQPRERAPPLATFGLWNHIHKHHEGDIFRSD